MSGDLISVRRVTSPVNMDDLTAAELEALRGAGAWYAKYHAVRIAELSDDPSAYAEHKREKFLTLIRALRKLGFEMAIPDGVRTHEHNAA
ncbi:hypothetical protein BH20ACT16_BH20ACT16_10720 [soil metagenome]